MPKAAEWRELETGELETRLEETKTELFNLRFQHVTGQLDNYSRLGQLRREVARLHTLIRAREIDEAEAMEAGTPRPAAATKAVRAPKPVPAPKTVSAPKAVPAPKTEAKDATDSDATDSDATESENDG
jgi:large subunit ribosomal protein L29